MPGHIFVVHGDITQLSAHAIAFSVSTGLTGGYLLAAFRRHVRGFGDAFARLPRKLPLGEARWLPLPGGGPSTRPRGMVVVAATGGRMANSEAEQMEKARRAVTAALEVAIEGLQECCPGERVLIALPAFRQGGGADRAHRLKSARVQVEAARALLDDPRKNPGRNVNVVFVTYTPDGYQIFLQARAEAGQEPGCPVRDPALPRLEHALREGRCVLFLGAGLSRGAGLPGWQELVQTLAVKLLGAGARGDQARWEALVRELAGEVQNAARPTGCDWRQRLEQLAGKHGVTLGSQEDLDYYLDVAQWYAERQADDPSLPAVTDLVFDLFGETEKKGVPLTLAHFYLMSLPIRLALTTNYDDLLERALHALRRHCLRIVEESHVVHTGQGGVVSVVKFHGDARTRSNIVLKRDDYAAFFRERPATALLLQGLLLNQTFLFVGYGLRDPNFREIYGNITHILKDAEREAFAVTVDPASETSPFLAGQWAKKQLHILAMPGADLGERVEQSWLFLDWLARVPYEAPKLFLARDVGLPAALGPLHDLRRLLIEEVGGELQRVCRGDVSDAAARYLATVLEFLVGLGWRPDMGWRTAHPDAGIELWQLWAKLADSVQDKALKCRLLRLALPHTEGLRDADEVRGKMPGGNEE